MSAILARDGVRLIRPLLLADPDRLPATLRAVGQPWIEDPSNSNFRFERVRWRSFIPLEQRVPVAQAAGEIGRERMRRERLVAEILASASIGAAGQLRLPIQPLLTAAPELGLAALSRCLSAVGGRLHPARRENLERLLANLAAGGPARTLGGCRVVRRADRLAVMPEAPPRLGAAPAARSVSQCGPAKHHSMPLSRANRPALMPGSFTVANLDVNIM